MSSQNHTINQVRVDVTGNEYGLVSKMQQQLSFAFNTGSFLSQLETLFDSLVPGGEYLEIQSLEIEMNDFKNRNLQSLLVKVIETSIREKLNSSSRNEIKIRTKQTFENEIYSGFLKFGILLNTSDKELIDRLHCEISQLRDNSKPYIESVLNKIGAQDPFVWKRLFFLLGTEGMMKYCQRVYHYDINLLKKLLAIVTRDKGNAPPAYTLPGGEPEFWKQIVPVMVNGWPEEKIKDMFSTDDSSGVNLPETIMQETRASFSRHIELEKAVNEGITIENAGMVMLWIELGKLIRELGYISDKSFKDTRHQQEAILLFHYVYSGNTDFREEELLLYKILCGWPVDEPVDPAFIPELKECETADRMLNDYIMVWRKDRNFSANWFRNTFLAREGILAKRPDGNWSLEIQKKTEDILITKTSVVRYSWMRELIFVNW